MFEQITSALRRIIQFNLFINDFFYNIKHSQVCNFADDNTIFACGENSIRVTTIFENGIFQLIIFGLKERHELSIEIDGDIIKRLIR